MIDIPIYSFLLKMLIYCFIVLNVRSMSTVNFNIVIPLSTETVVFN